MYMFIKRMRIIIVSLAVLICLTSCGKQNVDYNIDTASENTQDEERGEKENIRKSMVSDSGKASVEIDADMMIKTDKLPVVSLSPTPFTEEDMETYSDRLFDKGSVWQDLQFHTNEAEVDQYTDSDKLTAGDKPEYVFDTNVYEKMTGENDPLTGKPVTEIFEYETASCNLRGSVDGDDCYALSFYKNDTYARMIFSNLRYADFYTGMEADDQNICKYSKEEAETLASDFLVKMGIEGFVPVKTLYAKQNVNPEENMDVSQPDAYYIGFARSINGADVMYWDRNFLLNPVIYNDETESIEQNAFHEWISVYITDDGVVQMTYQAPQKIENISTDEAALLSFDSVQKQAESYFRELYLKNEDEFMIQINEIELGLAETIGEDGSSMLVPAWGYYSADHSGMEYSRTCWLLINAVDGSMIDISAD